MTGRLATDQNGGLEITKSTFSDSGDYMCTAVNALGRDEKSAKLLVEGKNEPCFNLYLYLFFFVASNLALSIYASNFKIAQFKY